MSDTSGTSFGLCMGYTHLELYMIAGSYSYRPIRLFLCSGLHLIIIVGVCASETGCLCHNFLQ
jgi:hypothetical protein